MNDDQIILRRFARTVRVAAHTALAEYEIAEARLAAAAPASFRALAAKGTAGFRFPDGGLLAEDGLLTATVERDPSGRPARLRIQALGAVGLDHFADREGRIHFGAGGPEAALRFDLNGRAAVALARLDLDESDLSSFHVVLVGSG